MERKPSANHKRKKWRKVLYEDQDVPDNYVDDSFLTEMKKNIYIRSYNYWDVVQQTGLLTQQICAVCFMIICWWFLDDKLISPEFLLQIIFPVFVLGCIIFLSLSTDVNSHTVIEYSKALAAVLCLTDFLSPVLKTLTKTISTDTIYAMSVCMILGHLLFHDYGKNAAIVSRSVSLNMSLFSSVCLASRLDTSEHVFAVVILALMLFGLWPILQKTLRQKTPGYQSPFTIFLIFIVSVLFSILDYTLSITFLALILCISFVCPLLLMSLQSHKNNIYGPWDEAVITLPDSPRDLKKFH